MDPQTCILTGAEGENPDDCTTHEHEEWPSDAAFRSHLEHNHFPAIPATPKMIESLRRVLELAAVGDWDATVTVGDDDASAPMLVGEAVDAFHLQGWVEDFFDMDDDPDDESAKTSPDFVVGVRQGDLLTVLTALAEHADDILTEYEEDAARRLREAMHPELWAAIESTNPDE